MVIYSLVLIIMMLARPKGIFGTNEIGDVLGFLKSKFNKRGPTDSSSKNSKGAAP
jgi:hypothetical protein